MTKKNAVKILPKSKASSNDVVEKQQPNKKSKLSDVVPDIEMYWDYDKNEGKKPSDYSKSSSENVYTFCPGCGISIYRTVRFSWKYDENGIGQVMQCRVCGKRRKGNSLTELCPEILMYWIYEKNEYKPERYTINSALWIYLKCPRCSKEIYRQVCEAIKKENDKYRVKTCADCSKEEAISKRRQGENNISMCIPDIEKYWNELNIYQPKDLSCASKEFIYLHCPGCGQVLYRSAFNSFRKKDDVWEIIGCIKCANKENAEKRIICGCLTEECPEIKEWWNYEKNSMMPEEITRGSHTEIYLQCPICGYEFTKTMHEFISVRRDGNILPNACAKCGYSSGDNINPEDNLTVICPEIKEWWNYNKNSPHIPEQFTKGSGFFAYLTCPDCGLELFTAIRSLLQTLDGSVVIRHKGKCRKYKAMASDNNLLKCYPQITEWWDYEKNYPDRPEEYTLFSPKKVYITCPKCNVTRFSRITDAFMLDGDSVPRIFKCPYCTGIRPIPGVNSLAALYPEIAKQCVDNDCEGIFPSSSSRMKWQCSVCGGCWFDLVINRVNGSGCPYCEGRQVLAGYNSFKVYHPELMDEWLEVENILIGIDPDQVFETYYGDVWWQCKKCGEPYIMSIHDRVLKKKRNHNPCPKCNGRRWKRVHFV